MFLRFAADAASLLCLSFARRERSGERAIARAIFAVAALPVTAALAGHSLASTALFVGNAQATFDEAAVREFPQAIYDKIKSKIARQTTFVQLNSDGLVRWSPRTLKLVDFVKAPSPTYSDTYLFAMRYVVSVFSEMDSLAAHDTSCQVVVVHKHMDWSEPTVDCAPVTLNQPAS